MTDLTKTERFLINEVDSMPGKRVRVPALAQTARCATSLTPRGFLTVLERMLAKRVLARVEGGEVTLTFGGMQAMRAAGMEVQE